jgi:hypothetical protein
MEEYSRPATLEDLKVLVESLNQQQADYLLIGGYALFAHGYHRATTDIDILVPATRQAGERIRQALMALPDQSAKDIDPAWFEEGENIRVADAFVVDIMLNACGETYETLQAFAETVDLEGVPIRMRHEAHQSKPLCFPSVSKSEPYCGRFPWPDRGRYRRAVTLLPHFCPRSAPWRHRY